MGKSRAVRIGIVVNAVSEALNASQDNIVDTPTNGVKLKTFLILEVAKISGCDTALLDVDGCWVHNRSLH